MSIIHHNFDGTQINQLLEDTVIAGKTVPKGYVNATEMCKTKGKRFAKYIEFSKTKPFLDALELVSPSKGLTQIIVIDSGSNETRGTWVSHEVAMNLAQWISPEFAAWASIVLSRVIKGEYEALTEGAREAEAKLIELWNKLREAGKQTRRTLTDAIKDWYERNPKGTSRPEWLMYAQTTNAIYIALWGMDAIAIEKTIGCPRNKLRDYLSAESLKHLDTAETIVSEYIDEDNIKPVDAVPLANIRRKLLTFKTVLSK